MKSSKHKNKLTDIADETVSANEFTGALQHISTDEEEIRRFHEQYNKE